MKIKLKKVINSQMNLIVPIDGTILINANGIADVSENCAKVLVNNTSDWEFIEDEKTDKINDKINEENDDDDIRNGFKDMKLKDLKEVASEAGYPVEEYEKIKSKKLMESYLLQKLKSDEDVEDEEEDEEDD